MRASERTVLINDLLRNRSRPNQDRPRRTTAQLDLPSLPIAIHPCRSLLCLLIPTYLHIAAPIRSPLQCSRRVADEDRLDRTRSRQSELLRVKGPTDADHPRWAEGSATSSQRPAGCCRASSGVSGVPKRARSQSSPCSRGDSAGHRGPRLLARFGVTRVNPRAETPRCCAPGRGCEGASRSSR